MAVTVLLIGAMPTAIAAIISCATPSCAPAYTPCAQLCCLPESHWGATTCRHDAGDLTRFTFPAAFTTSTLALGFLEFPDAFQQAGQVDYMLAALKWGADWLLEARYAPDSFVAVTWMPGSCVKQSHLFWGRPEEVPGAASVRALVAPMKGADLLAQGAAALAAVSVVFQQRQPTYANELLTTAQDLYQQVGRGCLSVGAGLGSASCTEWFNRQSLLCSRLPAGRRILSGPGSPTQPPGLLRLTILSVVHYTRRLGMFASLGHCAAMQDEQHLNLQACFSCIELLHKCLCMQDSMLNLKHTCLHVNRKSILSQLPSAVFSCCLPCSLRSVDLYFRVKARSHCLALCCTPLRVVGHPVARGCLFTRAGH